MRRRIPYSVEIAIEEYKEEPSIDRISATIYVARESPERHRDWSSGRAPETGRNAGPRGAGTISGQEGFPSAVRQGQRQLAQRRSPAPPVRLYRTVGTGRCVASGAARWQPGRHVGEASVRCIVRAGFACRNRRRIRPVRRDPEFPVIIMLFCGRSGRFDRSGPLIEKSSMARWRIDRLIEMVKVAAAGYMRRQSGICI